jgi:hypothetical protein
MLRRLRALGISIALDDFGTGYSTLASIEQLPLTRVKMDRSLIAEIDRRSIAVAHDAGHGGARGAVGNARPAGRIACWQGWREARLVSRALFSAPSDSSLRRA